jgi:Sulfotransferase family/Aspartyl/Asparaginyl beta-hydroxylase
MKLDHPFYKFPFRFDATRMAQEISAIPDDAWRRHPNDLQGNSFLPLTATRGDAFDDFDPPIKPTPWLDQSLYLRQVLAEFRTLIGRTRLMRLDPGEGVPVHTDNQQYWRRHTRVHVPVVTHPDVKFYCESSVVHMAAGEAWTFDNRRLHKVVNETPVRRIHLTMDTFGSTEFWRMAIPLGAAMPAPHPVPFRPGVRADLLYESYVGEPVMSAAEVDLELGDIVADAAAFANDPAAMQLLQTFTGELRNEWRTIWHLKGPADGLPHFIALADWARKKLSFLSPSLKIASSGTIVMPVLKETIDALVRRPQVPQTFSIQRARFDRPCFIVAAPRSGSTWLYEMLAQNLALKTLGGEGHHHVESIATLSPRHRNFDSNRLIAEDAAPDIATQLRANYLMEMRDAAGNLLVAQAEAPAVVRFLEKTPKNALRIPFLKSVFPDARFIFLHRSPRANISAIMDAWRSGGFVTYPGLPGWKGLPWSLLLIPGWRSLIGAPLPQIAMRQWRDTNATILSDLAALRGADWTAVDYDQLRDNTGATIERVCAFMDIPFGDAMRHAVANSGRLSRHTITPPDPQKWRRNAAEIEPMLGETQGVARQLAGIGMAGTR